MLKQASPKVLEALANLEFNGNFQVIVGWIKESKDETTTQLSISTDVPLYRAQGAFSVLDTLHNCATTAREHLAKLSTGAK